MPDPMLREFVRIPLGGMRDQWQAKFQRYIRDEVIPKLDRCDALELENATLKADLEKLTDPKPRRKAAEPVTA